MANSSKLYVNVLKNKYFRKTDNNYADCKYALTMMADKQGKDNIEEIANLILDEIKLENHSDRKTAHLVFYCTDLNCIHKIADETFEGHTIMSNVPYQESSREDILQKAATIQ